jgi:hypothetical protein
VRNLIFYIRIEALGYKARLFLSTSFFIQFNLIDIIWYSRSCKLNPPSSVFMIIAAYLTFGSLLFQMKLVPILSYISLVNSIINYYSLQDIDHKEPNYNISDESL